MSYRLFRLALDGCLQSIEWGFLHWALRREEIGKITVQKFIKRRYRSGLWAELVTGEF
eukprot:COSAG02_NODE_16006_length_1123_cov_2.426614_1_plen_57_part_10